MVKLKIYCDVIGCANHIEVFADEIDMNNRLSGIEDIRGISKAGDKGASGHHAHDIGGRACRSLRNGMKKSKK